jgi:hypothetical protein
VFITNFSFYLVSFIISLAVFLFFIGLGGAANAYIRSWFGDDSALISGFNSINPLVHIDEISILFYIIFGFIIRKRQPISFFSRNGWKGFLEKIVFISGSALFHLIISSLSLLLLFLWKGDIIIEIALRTPSGASSNFIKVLQNIFENSRGYEIISLLSLLYTVSINLQLSIFNFFVNLVTLFFEEYLVNYLDTFMVTFLSILALFLIFTIYQAVFLAFCWNIILLPIFLIKYYLI